MKGDYEYGVSVGYMCASIAIIFYSLFKVDNVALLYIPLIAGSIFYYISHKVRNSKQRSSK